MKKTECECEVDKKNIIDLGEYINHLLKNKPDMSDNKYTIEELQQKLKDLKEKYARDCEEEPNRNSVKENLAPTKTKDIDIST